MTRERVTLSSCRLSAGRGAVLPVLVFVVLSACTLERRSDPAANGTNGGGNVVAIHIDDALEPADSVLLVIALFREALDSGDLSAALSFLHPGAELHNDGSAPAGASAGEVLLAEVRLRQEGSVGYELLESDATVLGDAALVLSRYRTLEAPASGGQGALETIIMLRGGNGWRIRHLHRSAIDSP